MTVLATLTVLVHLATAATSTPSYCSSAVRSVGGRSIDLAPLKGFVEICSLDPALCKTLTAAYPSTVTTLGYFVTAQDWAAHQKDPAKTFPRYLIAQVAPTKTAAQLTEVRSFIRSQQDTVPDRARLAETLSVNGQARLGIFDDTPDSISFGAVVASPTPAAGGPLMAMSNSAIAIGPDLLSLYVYVRVADAKSVPQVELITKRWLECLRQGNRR